MLATWTGLPSDCSPKALSEAHGGDFSHYGTNTMGQKYMSTRFTGIRLPAYNEPLRLFYRDTTVVAIRVEFPDLADVPTLLKTFGAPDAKLDFYYGVSRRTEGEWVYPKRGLTLYLGSSGKNAVKLMVYPPQTIQEYMDKLYTFEAPKEHPEEEGN